MLRELSPASLKPGLVTHHLGAAELLRVAQDLYGTQPRRACLLTIGAGSIELGEGLSPAVRDALPDAEELARAYRASAPRLMRISAGSLPA